MRLDDDDLSRRIKPISGDDGKIRSYPSAIKGVRTDLKTKAGKDEELR